MALPEREKAFDTATEINPWRIPLLLWELMEPYFKRRWKAELVRQFPEEEVVKPTISYRLARITPGGGKDGNVDSRGFSYESRSTNEQGLVEETQKQFVQLFMDWAVFGTSAEEADDLVWDLFNALNETVGPVIDKIPGTVIAWTSGGEPALPWKEQDRLKVRSLRYEIRTPLRRKSVLPELRQIVMEDSVGRWLSSRTRLTRTSADEDFQIPVEATQRVVNILTVFLKREGVLYLLKEGIDYRILLEEDLSQSIRWLDGPGATPEVGDEFIVDYEYAPIVLTRTITQRD